MLEKYTGNAEFGTECKTLSIENAKRMHESMMDKCYNEKNKYFAKYGGKGIKVAPEWQDFDRFYNFLENQGITDDMTMWRVNPDWGFNRINVRFEKVSPSSPYKKKFLSYDGETKCMSDWDVKFNVPKGTTSTLFKAVGSCRYAIPWVLDMLSQCEKIRSEAEELEVESELSVEE